MCGILVNTIAWAQTFTYKGNMITYRGNHFEMSGKVYDTTVTRDKATGKLRTYYTKNEVVPLKMNGVKVYKNYEVVAPPAYYAEFGALEDYLFRELKEELNKLPDGDYSLVVDNVVVDGAGKLVYYEYHEMKGNIPEKFRKSIRSRLDTLMVKAPPFRPGQVVSHQNSIVFTDITTKNYIIQVRKHKATIIKE